MLLFIHILFVELLRKKRNFNLNLLIMLSNFIFALQYLTIITLFCWIHNIYNILTALSVIELWLLKHRPFETIIKNLQIQLFEIKVKLLYI